MHETSPWKHPGRLVAICLLLLVVQAGMRASAETSPRVAPATIVSATAELDTYVISGGRLEGYLPGDVVDIRRGSSKLCQAVLFTCSPHTSTVTVLGQGVPLRGGDLVEFSHRRVALPPEGRLRSTEGTPLRIQWTPHGPDSDLVGTWSECRTQYCVVYAETADTGSIEDLVQGLDDSFHANEAFMGFAARTPMPVYFCPVGHPLTAQPCLAKRTAGMVSVGGMAFWREYRLFVNLGRSNGRPATHARISQIARHEMNHMFTNSIRNRNDREGLMTWFTEAMAYAIQAEGTRGAVLARTYVKERMKRVSLGSRNLRELGQEYRRHRTSIPYVDSIFASIVFYLQDRYGGDVIPRILRAVQTRDLADAFVDVCGKSMDQIEVDWRAYYDIH